MTRRSIALLLIIGLLLASLAPLVAGAQPADRETEQAGFDPSTVTLELEEILEGFERPSEITNAGDGSDRLFISELRGVVWVAIDGEVLPEPFLDISDIVRDEDGEQGFFGIAFHPNYAENGQFYAVYTKQPDGDNVLARFSVSPDDPNRADPASLTELIVIEDQFANHNGGDLAFGPDGYLYYATGDEGGDGDPKGNAQNPQSLFGKMLRIDVDSGDPYAIPPDNPFIDDPDVRDEIWATGLRNPFRYSFDRETGDLYIADVGQNMWEEVNFQPADSPGGENYGWPLMEGTHCYPEGTTDCDPAGLTLPVLEYSHEGERGVRVGCSVTGGYVYRGEETPFMDGVYIFGDWCEGRIFAGWQDEAGEWRMEELLDTFIMMTAFGEDEAGELYMTDMLGGSIHRLHFSQTAPRPVIDALDPTSVIAGSEAFTLTITGRNFSEGSVARWDGQDLPTTFVDSQTVTATVDAALVAAEGSASVGVVDGEFASNEITFIIRPAFGPEVSFERAWQRTDQPVANGAVARTWIWGPEPLTPPATEPYSNSPGGERTVQYFDKARMEITNPEGDATTPWYVTNGLLVVELMSGEVQVGHADFEERAPAEVNVAGDPGDPDAVTYVTLGTLADAAPYDEGQTITSTLTGDGSLGDDPDLASYDVTAGPLEEHTNHRTASVFWEFMTASGLVMEGDDLVEDALFENPYYATGLPVTEAYWTYVDVGGNEKLVLLQCFERRCLTYTPDNPEGWQVEAGNVGMHYYAWRYGEE